MKFKNALEQRCYEIACNAIGPFVRIEHNKRLQIESALFPEVASFKGPPAKEIDVLVAELLESPKITLLVSCKEFVKRAEPAHVQEWAAVVRTMNNYSDGTLYFGMVVSSSGFTSGCEAWATSHNLGLIPPLKGKNLAIAPDTVLRMFERSVIALRKRVRLKSRDLAEAPAFFDFIYSLIADFEGHEEVVQDCRYYVFPEHWVSSFGEMYSSLAGRRVKDLAVLTDGVVILQLSDNVSCRFTGTSVEFGSAIAPGDLPVVAAACSKNIEGDPCTLDFVKGVVRGLPITSAADFGDYLEFGLDQRFSLGMHIGGFHLVSTQSPVSKHRL
jgi:hypothetical protein